MDLAAFRASVEASTPVDHLSHALQALWHDAKGDWQTAHGRIPKNFLGLRLCLLVVVVKQSLLGQPAFRYYAGHAAADSNRAHHI